MEISGSAITLPHCSKCPYGKIVSGQSVNKSGRSPRLPPPLQPEISLSAFSFCCRPGESPRGPGAAAIMARRPEGGAARSGDLAPGRAAVFVALRLVRLSSSKRMTGNSTLSVEAYGDQRGNIAKATPVRSSQGPSRPARSSQFHRAPRARFALSCPVWIRCGLDSFHKSHRAKPQGDNFT